MIIALKSRVVKYISHVYAGKIHDFTLLKEELSSEVNWFEQFHIKVDLGYQGIASQYVFKKLSIPHKKSKNTPLTDEQKEENTKLAAERIIVEHSIGGIKRYRCLSDRMRLHDFVFYDVLLGVCTGLWNFYLSN
jgi:hypothetical protein